MKKNDLQRIIEGGVGFFATGDEYVRNNLNLKFIPHEHTDKNSPRGVILADANQNLLQSYSIAKQIFEHVEHGTVKFVLIGLSPYVVSENNSELLVAWDVKTNAPILEDYIQLCIDNGAKPVVVVLPVHSSIRKDYDSDVVLSFRNTINEVVEKHKSSLFVDLLDVRINVKLFNGNWFLSTEGSALVSVLLGAKLYFENLFSAETVCSMNNEYFNLLKKSFPNFYKKLMHHTFCRMVYNDFNRLAKTLSKEICLDLMANVLSDMTYNHLVNLSNMLTKDDYNDLAARIFESQLETIRRKDKIKLGFYFDSTSKWCGDELYNLFAKDKRFEPTIFIYPTGDNLTRKEFQQDVEKFKARGLNVSVVKNPTSDIPVQDILIQTSPYDDNVPRDFRLINLKFTTLLIYIPYSHTTASRDGFIRYNPFLRVLWKAFFPSTTSLEYYNKTCSVGMPRAIFSGYPRMDIFFNKNAKFKFDWKMTRPDSKKIIWAPHHTTSDSKTSLKYSTFQWNHQFMYEFAKAHPEISWVVKPHPWLFRVSVSMNVFPSIEACQEYFQKWNDLPNAQVYTGAYYQDIFATSDGMIHDSGSFIAEYQYVDKPMIYLMRPEKKFNGLGQKILETAYLVDGKDLDAIAATMQRVFIEGDDYKAVERREVFDKYLNYPKHLGMLASEFIYKNIADELKVVEK
ncbi:MAG: CDP-glycerol glycerophosphotransferase family protein [Selenomonadaceae bacterium]|nr:CDP-glycerol glycerophosphotransferase family protein [Selenomonadaceae bacterium]